MGSNRKGPALLAIFFGIFGVILGFSGAIGFGMKGAFIGFAFGTMAIALGIIAKRYPAKKGLGGIITGVLALGSTLLGLGFLGMIAQGVQEYGPEKAPILSSYVDELKGGFYGLALKVEEDGVDESDLLAEIDRISQE